MDIIKTENAPEAIGPYSQGIKTGNLLFLSGQIPLDPQTMQIVGTDIKTQTEQIFKNIKAIAESENLTLSSIIKTTVFLKDMNDFPAMNAAYQSALNGHKPARSTVEVTRLPKDALIEIECIIAI